MNSAARIEAFLEMMSVERGAADNTLASYRRDLEDASAAIAGGLAAARSADIRAYLGGMAARGFAASSQARKLSALRQFFKFLYAENLRADDPTGTLDSPRKDRPLPKTMAEAETGRLLDRAADEAADASLSDGERTAAKRMHALVEVLYATGLARFRACRAPCHRGVARRAILRGARQGQQGAHGAAVAESEGRDARLAGRARPGRLRSPKVRICFRHRPRAATCPGRSLRAT